MSPQAKPDIVYDGKRTLDFTPFEAALEGFTEARIADLDALLKAATIPVIQVLFGQESLTASELTCYYVHRIRAYDVDKLNSVIELNPDALAIAAALDEERAQGTVRGPLHGIPVLLKDNIGTGDSMHVTAGAKALESNRSDRDAFIVERLREVGAIILGKTNLSEWANYMDPSMPNGFSVVGGQTHNPYGPFDTWGSSSGSAVAVASHFAVAAIGSETCGSISAPASINSVVGIKPSLGLVSRDRVIPLAGSLDTTGPMARNVTDVSLLFNALVNPDPTDYLTSDALQETPEAFSADFSAELDGNGLRGRRFGAVRGETENEAGDFALLDGAMARMRVAGAEVVMLEAAARASKEDVAEFLEVLKYEFKDGLNKYLATLGETAGAPSLEAIIAFNAEDLPNRAPYGQRHLTEAQDNGISGFQNETRMRTLRDKFRREITTLLTDHALDALITIANEYAIHYAVAGYPAITVPMGYRENGEPLGITFVGRYGDDAKLVRLAYAFEQVTRFRKDPAL